MPFDGKDFALPAVETDAVLRCLVGAKALLSDPTRWIKNALALDKRGELVIPESASAVSFCAIGALDHVGFDHRALWTLTAATPRKNIPRYNNAPMTTHSDIMALFDRAISARRGELS